MNVRITFLAIILIHALGSYSQNETYSIAFNDLPLDSVLVIISDSTGYNFSYNAEIIPEGSLFSLSLENKSIDELLNHLLLGTGIRHHVQQDQIVLTYKRSVKSKSKSEARTFSIYGRVIDADSQMAIAGANVFLSGTNMGSVTDLEGYYLIDEIPVGTYEVIFSHLSYAMNAEIVQQEKPGGVTLNAEMVFQSRVLDTVNVISRRLIGPEERAKFLKIFKKEFLGRSTNADRCRLLNPEVLDFVYDPKEDKLEVFALQPLEIINEYLGYKIFYVFEYFQKVKRSVDFYGKARFNHLQPKNKRELRRWKRRRRRVYRGSFLHFRRALVQDKLEDERFRISLIPVESIADIHDSEELPVDREQILDSSNDQYTLNFEGFLKVIYRKRPDREFSNQYAYEEESSRRQVSYLKLNKDEPVVLRNNGRMELPGLATFGYWYWERIGDILPENYHPDR